MTRAEAYWILHEMMVETFSVDQSKALSMALHDIQFVDLMPGDVVPVVRCKDCIHCEDLEPHADIYGDDKHCRILRGDLTSNVWHKYKKYYRDYSLVEPDGFCSEGLRKEADGK